MAFLKNQVLEPTGPVIRTERLMLRIPLMSDYAQWASLRAMSRNHLTPWEPQWTADELTRSAYRRRIRHYTRELRDDLGYAFFIFDADRALVGGVTLANVRRGVTQSAELGYWTGIPYASRGHMTAAVRSLFPYVFDSLRLHRLAAACLPSNRPSIRVLEKCGFQYEGLARQYLKINGVWQDHLLFARLDSDAKG